MSAHRPHHVGCASPRECAVDRRALTLWPRLDSRALTRCRHDVSCIVRLVERRTRLSSTVILRLLSAPPVTTEEPDIWFG